MALRLFMPGRFSPGARRLRSLGCFPGLRTVFSFPASDGRHSPLDDNRRHCWASLHHVQRCRLSDEATRNQQGQALGKLDDEHGKMMMLFTCGVCDKRVSRMFSKKAYRHGVVLARCPGCENLHLVADNLGWFGKENQNIESILAAKGEKFRRSWDEGGLELDPEDVELTSQCLNDQEEEKEKKRENT